MTSTSTRAQLPFVRWGALEIAHFSLKLRFRLRRTQASMKRRARDPIVSLTIRIFRGRTISIQFSWSVGGRLHETRRVLLSWCLIAFRRDNISALISLCGAPATLEINLFAPVYLRSLDSRLLALYYLSISSSCGTFTTHLNEARSNRRFPLHVLTILPCNVSAKEERLMYESLIELTREHKKYLEAHGNKSI